MDACRCGWGITCWKRGQRRGRRSRPVAYDNFVPRVRRDGYASRCPWRRSWGQVGASCGEGVEGARRRGRRAAWDGVVSALAGRAAAGPLWRRVARRRKQRGARARPWPRPRARARPCRGVARHRPRLPCSRPHDKPLCCLPCRRSPCSAPAYRPLRRGCESIIFLVSGLRSTTRTLDGGDSSSGDSSCRTPDRRVPGVTWTSNVAPRHVTWTTMGGMTVDTCEWVAAASAGETGSPERDSARRVSRWVRRSHGELPSGCRAGVHSEVSRIEVRDGGEETRPSVRAGVGGRLALIRSI